MKRSQRTSVMLSAEVFCMNRGEPTRHRITNISETGVRLANGDMLSPGSVVVVTIGQVEHAPADVKWVRGGSAGLAFYDPIDIARARTRRTATGAAPAPSAGWLADLNDAYSRGHRG